MKKHTITLLLIGGIILIINLLAGQLFFRLDLTEDKQYTLSQATLDVLDELTEPVTVTAYFSEDLPPQIAKVKQDFKEMLVEYSTLSKGMVNYEFVDPAKEKKEEEVMQNGIQPVMLNVTDSQKDERKQKKAYLGALVQMGNEQDAIPFIQPGGAIEYSLTTSIKKIAVLDKPAIAIVQGHGEPPLNEMAQVQQTLSILYAVEALNLDENPTIPEKYKTVAIIAPKDSFPPTHIQALDAFLGRGGNLFIAYNSVNGDLSNASGTAVTTGLETWLKDKGLVIENNFVVDAKCATVNVQRQQGFFRMMTPVQFPYIPVINNFAEHPITKGLEAVNLPFASPVNSAGRADLSFTPIVMTSPKAGVIAAPTMFDVNKQWRESDFPMSNITLGAVLEGNIVGDVASKIVLIGDGDFGVNGPRERQQTLQPDNISLMNNGIDWLSDDTGLIELRTRGVSSRPLKKMEDGARSLWKWSNFLLPLLLAIVYGVFRMQMARRRRIKRMEESYG